MLLALAQQRGCSQRPSPAGSAVPPRFAVAIDAAHGGADTGGRIAERLLEKDLTLSLAVRLRSALEARGLVVVPTRMTDTTVSALDRAQTANHAAASACILLHATATGSGVHIFTSSLSVAKASPGAMISAASPTEAAQRPLPRFVPWQTAQAAWVPQSIRLSSEINSALALAEIPVTLGSTSMQPLDSFSCPAVAVELAPPPASAGHASTENTSSILDPKLSDSRLSDPNYQARIVDALVAAVLQFREDTQDETQSRKSGGPQP